MLEIKKIMTSITKNFSQLLKYLNSGDNIAKKNQNLMFIWIIKIFNIS